MDRTAHYEAFDNSYPEYNNDTSDIELTKLLDKTQDVRRNSTNGSEGEHCHGNAEDPSMDKKARKRLLIASGLCLIFMIGEATGGALAHSLAIMTDAAHLLTDFASFLISLLAIFLAGRPATKKMSFGWYRAEVVGALISVLMIWLVTGILVYLAILRIMQGEYEINGKVMLITSAIGVAVNLIMAATLHQHTGHGSHGHSHSLPNPFAKRKPAKPLVSNGMHGSNTTRPLAGAISAKDVSDSTADPEKCSGGDHQHGGVESHAHGHNHSYGGSDDQYEPVHGGETQNINVRAAFIHVIGDLIQSVGVMIAAMVIYFQPQYKIADPICTFIFSVLVLITTLTIIRDAMVVLMEGTPKGLDFTEVKAALYGIPGIVEVHNLRMWSLTMNKTAVSVHLAVMDLANAQETLNQANHLLRRRFGVHDVTIQMEKYVAEMADCHKCQELKD